MKWRDMGTGLEVDLVPYIRNYLRDKPDTKIMIGTDSQTIGKRTKYALVVALHTNRGAKILYSRVTFDKISDSFTRLMKEVQYTIEIGESIKDGLFLKRTEDGTGKYPIVSLHIDLNPDKKYLSNKVLLAVLGWGESLGFDVEYKPRAIAASYCADVLCKKK